MTFIKYKTFKNTQLTCLVTVDHCVNCDLTRAVGVARLEGMESDVTQPKAQITVRTGDPALTMLLRGP